jgi:uncharacterized cupredoxin-like copper-binding protein
MWNKGDGTHGMTTDLEKVKAGPVTFKVSNKSADMTHEFLWVKTNLEVKEFPVTDGGVKVDEDKLEGVEELGDLEPGKSGEATATLEPGRYVLFCNEEGHFMAGKHQVLIVE